MDEAESSEPEEVVGEGVVVLPSALVSQAPVPPLFLVIDIVGIEPRESRLEVASEQGELREAIINQSHYNQATPSLSNEPA